METIVDKIHRFVGKDVFGQVVVKIPDLLADFYALFHLVFEIAVKRQITAKHGKEDNASGPDIGQVATVGFMGDNFRAGVVRTATGRFQPLIRGLQGSHAEVGDLCVSLTIKEDVLGLEITMADVEGMAVCETRYYLSKEANSLGLRQTSVGLDVVEQLPTFDQLKDKISATVSQGSR